MKQQGWVKLSTKGKHRRPTAATVLSHIASAKEDGSDVLGFVMLGPLVDREGAWEAWVMEQTERGF